MLPTETVIVGGGIVGLTAAVTLKKKARITSSDADVTVLEKNTLGGGSTLRAGCGLRTVYKHPSNIRLSRAGIQFWKKSEQILDTKVDFRQNGYLFLTNDTDTDAVFNQEAQRQQLYGFQSAYRSPPSGTDIRLPLNRDNYRAALFAGNAALSSPQQMIDSLRETAHSLDIDIQTDTTVTGITDANNSVTVETQENGEFYGETAVNAAGVWAKRLANTAGVSLPIVPQRRRLAVLDTTISPDEPLTVDVDSGVYFLPDEDGTVHAGGHFSESEPYDPRNPRAFSDRVDTDWNQEFKQESSQLWDGLAESEITESWTGLYAMTPSRRPIIDRVGNIVHVSGFSGHGIMQAPGAAQMVVTLLAERSPPTNHSRALAYDRAERDPDIQF